ncbi:kinetochore CENP-C fungal-like protein [Apodospora peruviana]|uniref:CENP-C homolog n=1 Tax=Apodospora peruviana TaxID=516989 RepID=A0AAE0HXS2_9PEZI|nr:kinetochore CENP-C fungal-like protein [Apodospora peruviana]
MVPRPSQHRRTIGLEGEHVYDFGNVGRKTGVTLKDTGIRDEHGMEPIDNLFSSPRKPDGSDDDDNATADDDEGSGEDMDITTTSGIGPAAILNAHAHNNRLPLPLPRVRSPVKTSLKSPAQRNRLLARSSSPLRGSVMRERDSQPNTQPSRDQSTAKRRLDFSTLQAGAKALSQPANGGSASKVNGINGLGRGSANGYRARYQDDDDDDDDDDEEDEEEEEEAPRQEEEEEIDVDAFVEESMVMLSGGDDEPQEPDYHSPVEEEPVRAVAAAKRKPGRKAKQKDGPPPPPVAKPTAKKTGRRVVEEPEPEEEEEEEPVAAPEEEEDDEEEDDEEEDDEEEDDEEEVSFVQAKQTAGPGKRGRPAKDKAPAPAPKAKASPPTQRGRPAKNKAPTTVAEESPAQQPPSSDLRSRKRRSLNEDAYEEGSSARQSSKRQRTAEAEALVAPPKAKGRPAKKPVAAAVTSDDGQPEASTTSTSRKPAAAAAGRAKQGGDGGRKRKSSIGDDVGDTSQVIVPRGPPLPKSRGLLINRREAAGEMHRTRSGRTSFKPLAYWRNERVDYREDESVTDAFASTTRGPRKFLLPSIKEVVRVDEPEPDLRDRSKKRGGGRRRRSGYDSADDGGLADAWERNPGAIEGEATVWYPEHEKNPPAIDEEVEVMDRQLAISGRSIKTSKVKNATFKFAKTLSEGFFGAGVVDMLPGSVKTQKNSRKMFMTFFVFSGKVLVSINETTFRISKGGMWFVPRGNYYSIENDYDQPARLFFSQGCEVAARLPSSESVEPEQSVMMEGDGGHDQSVVT